MPSLPPKSRRRVPTTLSRCRFPILTMHGSFCLRLMSGYVTQTRNLELFSHLPVQPPSRCSTLAKGRSEWPWYLILVVVLAVASIFFTVLFVVATLTPRVSAETSKPHLENSDISVNPLFFGHISANYNNNDIRYTTVLSTLTSNPEELTNHIANQVHANSRIATTKMRYINTSIWCGLASVVFVAVLALTSGIGN